jgi:hypothetical protein
MTLGPIDPASATRADAFAAAHRPDSHAMADDALLHEAGGVRRTGGVPAWVLIGLALFVLALLVLWLA